MNIFEISETLPNGIHDSALRSLRIDYIRRLVEFELDVWIGSMDDPPSTREIYRRGNLSIKGFRYCSIELPDESYPYDEQAPPTIDLVGATAFVPDGAFGFRLWVSQWNAFVHIAGEAADFTWKGEPINQASAGD
jgi:hypothetical protein